MDADALAPYIARPSAAMVLRGHYLNDQDLIVNGITGSQ